jgi:multidrug resistance efflux pump
MKGITDEILGLIKNLRASGGDFIKKENAKSTTSATPVHKGKTMNKMILKLNADQEISNAMKELDVAETNLKKARRNQADKYQILECETQVVEKKAKVEGAKLKRAQLE